MDYKIYKINNGYKVGRKDGKRLCAKYDNRLYITRRPMRRDGAKKLLIKLELEERGLTMNVKSKKKKFCDGFIRIDPIKTKRNKNNFYGNALKNRENKDDEDELEFNLQEIILFENEIKSGNIGTIGTIGKQPIKFCDDPSILNTFKSI
tara:strand:- start:1446 stop:1892 length:447 start_codon:yes stop_codon:yes gene_type:complete